MGVHASRQIIEKHCGGIRGGWDNLLAVIPGGASVPMRTGRDRCAAAVMDFDGLREVEAHRLRHRGGDRHGQVHGHHQARSGACIGYFYKHESCGQCTPCREGTGWMWRVLERMARGEAEMGEIDTLLDVASQVEGHTICALGDAAAWPIQGLFRHFRPEVEARISRYRVAKPHVQGATLLAAE